jgi:YbbR domain-containing protein
MIKFLRELCFHDFWLKLFSLALAVLIWLTVSFAVEKQDSPMAALRSSPQVRTFSGLPVVVMSSAQDVRHLTVRPAEVEVTVQGERDLIRNLKATDIQPIVDLTGVESSKDSKKRIRVSNVARVSLVRVEPEEVEVVFPASQ